MSRLTSMPSTRLGGSVKLILLFAVQIGFILAFHAMGSIDKIAIDFSNLSVWLESTPPEIALIASIRLLALAFSYWILVSSLIYMVARSFHLTGLIRAMEFTTIPGVRKVIDAGLAAAIVGGTVFGGAAAVFAKQSDATKIASPAAVTSSFKESRALFNPNASPAGANTSLSIVNPSANPNSQVAVTGDATRVVTSQRVVVASQAPDVTPTQDVSEPTKQVRDDSGHIIPSPSEKYVPPTPDSGSDEIVTTTSPSPRVVVSTQDQTTTTTAPKSVVPPTTTPITSEPEVQVGGKQVVRDTGAPDVRTNNNTETSEDTSTNAERTYTVVAGDNFWKIAKEQVRNSLGHEPSNAEVANYWVQLIDANTTNIRSGDPDLIFPGEVFTLPPV